MTSYTIAPAPKYAGMQDWDCARCGRMEVKPVFLTDGSAVSAFGSGCAAVLLGRPRSAARAVKDEAARVQRAADARHEQMTELREAAERAAKDWANRDLYTDDVQRMRRNYHRGSEAGKITGLFPDYILAVAATGEVFPA